MALNRYEKWVGFRKALPQRDYEALKPNFLGRLYVLHGTPGSITKPDLLHALNQGRIMMNRIYAKQSTTTKNAILQEYPKLMAKSEADKQLIHQLKVEQTYHRMMIGVATNRALSYAKTTAQMRAQILQGPNHKQLGLAALKALPRRETSSLPLEVVYPPPDPGVVSSKDLFSGFFDGTDEELTLDLSIAGSGVE